MTAQASASVPLPSTFPIPISNGIFAHCDRIGVAIWVFLWMVDRTTREIATADGYAEGLVYGGKAIRSRQIAEDLNMATRTIHVHLERLIAAGYLRRINHGIGVPAGYSVARSKKWKTRLSLALPEEAPTPSQDCANSLQFSCEPSHNSADPSQIPALPSQNSAPYIEDNTRTIQGLTTTASGLAETLEPSSSSSPIHESSSPSGIGTLPVELSSTTTTPPPSSAAPPAPGGSGDLSQAIEIWNRNCGETISKIRAGSTKRREKLKTRIGEARDRETYFEEFERAVKLCSATPFLQGKNDHEWTPDFDWLIKNDENMGKVLEGKYGKPTLGAAAKHPTYYPNPFDRPEYADDYVAGGQA